MEKFLEIDNLSVRFHSPEGVARALCVRPELIVADEPVSTLKGEPLCE